MHILKTPHPVSVQQMSLELKLQSETRLTLVAGVHILHALDALVLVRQVKVHDTLLHNLVAAVLWQQAQLLNEGLDGACRQGMKEGSVETARRGCRTELPDPQELWLLQATKRRLATGSSLQVCSLTSQHSPLHAREHAGMRLGSRCRSSLRGLIAPARKWGPITGAG